MVKHSLLVICTCCSLYASHAQPGHWRYSVEMGGVKSLNQSVLDKPSPPGLAVAEGRTGIAGSLSLERSIANQVSARVSLGVLTSRLVRASYVAETNTDGAISSFGGLSDEAQNVRPLVGSLGAQWNSRPLGRLIFTAGLDAVVRINTGSLDSSPNSQTIHSYSYGKVEYPSIAFNNAPVGNKISIGPQVRLGTDFRLNAKTFVSLNGLFQYGVQPLREGQRILTYAGETFRPRITNTGNLLGFSAGLKYNLSLLRENQSLRTTAYNVPFVRVRFDRETEQTFAAGSWVTGFRGGYWPGNLNQPGSSEFSSYLSARIGYAVLNRFLVGLSGETYWFRPINLGHIRYKWLSGGPFVRYQLTDSWFSPFIETAYQFGSKKMVADFTPISNGYSFSDYLLTPGFTLWLQKHLWLEVALSFRSARQRNVFPVPLAPSSGTSQPPAPGVPGPPIMARPYRGPLPQLGIFYQFNRH